MATRKRLPSPAPPQAELVARRIHLVRGVKVMLDADLASLYGVPTSRLNEAVKRNRRRFPDDFLFQLTAGERDALTSQSATSKGRGGRRYLPYAFTEQGVAMLSSVLNSERAIAVNIVIMRAFVRLREVLAGNEELRRKVDELERGHQEHGAQIRAIFDAIRRLLEPPAAGPKRRIGFPAEGEPAD